MSDKQAAWAGTAAIAYQEGLARGREENDPAHWEHAYNENLKDINRLEAELTHFRSLWTTPEAVALVEAADALLASHEADKTFHSADDLDLRPSERAEWNAQGAMLAFARSRQKGEG